MVNVQGPQFDVKLIHQQVDKPILACVPQSQQVAMICYVSNEAQMVKLSSSIDGEPKTTIDLVLKKGCVYLAEDIAQLVTVKQVKNKQSTTVSHSKDSDDIRSNDSNELDDGGSSNISNETVTSVDIKPNAADSVEIDLGVNHMIDDSQHVSESYAANDDNDSGGIKEIESNELDEAKCASDERIERFGPYSKRNDRYRRHQIGRGQGWQQIANERIIERIAGDVSKYRFDDFWAA